MSRPASPFVVLFGDARELGDELGGARVVRMPVGERIGSDAIAVVLDLRSVRLADYLAAIEDMEGPAPPLLVVSATPVGESVLAASAAHAVVVAPTPDALRREAALVVELGLARAAVAEAHRQIDTLYRTLLHRERFDHAILDGLEVGIVITDDEGIVSFVNRAAVELLRLGPDVTGMPVAGVLGLAERPGELVGGDARRVLAYNLTAPDGTELDLELSVSRGNEMQDERVGFFFIFRDLSDEKKKEAERRRFERLAAMGTMVAGFAHEVRNPVAAMRSIAEELAEELRDAGMTMPHIARMLHSLDRIERLVRTSLQFGRPAAPKRAPQRPWVIVSGALAELGPRLRGLSGEIVVDVEPDLSDVNVDERQIAQALVILVHNALDAVGDPGRVVVRVRQAQEVRIEVIDDGPGISADIIGRIFDPFFTTKPSGTGLGLSIAQQIVSENGARLEVASSPGCGAVFSIVIPP